MIYTAETDPLCYPGTTVLRNKAGLTDQDDLDQFELAMSFTRAEEDWPAGKLDQFHYCAIHHHLFQDVYDWAGEYRQIRIGKVGNWFCSPEYIEREMERVFSDLSEAEFLVNLSRADFSDKAAHFLAEINAIHPFREGNGRTQMSLLMILAENASFQIDEERIDRDRVMQAMVDSFKGNEVPLAAFIFDLIR